MQVFMNRVVQYRDYHYRSIDTSILIYSSLLLATHGTILLVKKPSYLIILHQTVAQIIDLSYFLIYKILCLISIFTSTVIASVYTYIQAKLENELP